MKIKKYFSVLFAIIFVCSFGLLFSATAEAAKELDVGSTSVNSAGTEEQRECEIPLTLKGGFNDVNGLAFTLTYDSDVFEFLGLVQAGKEVYNGDDYDPHENQPSDETIENALFYIANTKADEGLVLVAAAAAEFLAADTADVVPFNAQFRVYEGAADGVYDIGVQKTIIGPDTAADAGYDEPTELDVAVGLDPAGEPTEAVSYPVELLPGTITVTSTYTLSGKVTVNGEVLPGVQVMVMDGDVIVGFYPVNEDGSFEIVDLDSGKTYVVKAVYGSESSGGLTADQDDVYNWEGLTFGSIAGTIYGLEDGQEATLNVNSDEKMIDKSLTITGDGSDQGYAVDKLLPGDDYIVSISGNGIPTIYYDGKFIVDEASLVTVEADISTEGIDFMLDIVPSHVLDIDGNGEATPLGDGVMIVRYLFGFRGSTLIQGAIDAQGSRNNATDIEDYMASILSAGYLDVDGNGATEPLGDGVMIVRRLFGFSGTTLTSGAIGVGSTRDAGEIALYIDSLK
ncbi:MAG: hypothetical protein R6U13_12070 [Desulfatiglandaceae bacterium]